MVAMEKKKRSTPAKTSPTQAPTKQEDSGALARGLKLLGVMNEASRPLNLIDISELTGLASSTCHRILQTLLATGHVYRSDATRYAVGVSALSPLALEHPLNMIRRDAGGILQTLQAEHGASALLIAFLGVQRMVVDYVPGRGSVAPYFDTKIEAPYHASVSGKLLLSSLDEAARDALLGDAPLASRTEHTHVNRAALRKELAHIVESGWAANRNENLLGVSAVGVRLLAPSGRAVGALVLSGVDEHFANGRLDLIVEHLLRAANVLTRTSMSVRAVARFLNV